MLISAWVGYFFEDATVLLLHFLIIYSIHAVLLRSLSIILSTQSKLKFISNSKNSV